MTGFCGFCFLVSGCTKVDFVVDGFRGLRFLGSGFRASDWISWISLFRQTSYRIPINNIYKQITVQTDTKFPQT